MIPLLLWARYVFLALFGSLVGLYGWIAYTTREEK